MLEVRYSTVDMPAGVARAVEVFEEHGGILATSAALRAGIHPAVFYSMKNAGLLERLSHGVYRLARAPLPADPDLVVIAMRIPRGVLCLISALSFHGLTTQIPHRIDVALPRGSRKPKLEHPPLDVHWFTGRAYTEGIETHDLEGAKLRVYSPEKTLADCFKFRKRIGMDTVLEALRAYRDRQDVRIDELLEYASICRVRETMRPYLEAIF